MTIREMSTTSTDSMIASNFLSIQLNESKGRESKDFKHEWMSWKLCLMNKLNQQTKENRHGRNNSKHR
ncbi:dihydrodipicolinate reductase [Streptococcus pneumoniae GA62331]|nr:dihydrodipicolinate reductase [Streptococcus pneumoniae GA62331]